MKDNHRIQEIMDSLETGVREIYQSDRYRKYLEVQSHFRTYSLSNTLLICRQFPAATYVAGYQVWTKTFGRHIRRGEKGIRILAPVIRREQIANEDGSYSGISERRLAGFRQATVFDISQTEGRDIPVSLAAELNQKVRSYESFLRTLVLISPVPVYFQKIESGARGFYRPLDGDIFINEGMPQAQTVKTLLHEIAHALLHSRDLCNDRESRLRREIEAESVAYAVSSYYGIDTKEYSFGYIAGWSKDRELNELKNSLDTIREAVGKMIDMISSVTLCRSASAEYPGYPRVHQEALSFEQASHSQTEWRQ